MSKMIVGYQRTSTKEQNLSRQRDALMEYGVDRIFSDQSSGISLDREGYSAAKQLLRKGDTLVVLDLDRISRSYEDILNEWRYFTDNEIEIVVINMPFLKTGNQLTDRLINNVLLELLAYISSSELERMKKRQKEGIESARKAGVKFGRPSLEINTTTIDVINSWQNKNITAKRASEILGISRSSIYNLKKRIDDIKTN